LCARPLTILDFNTFGSVRHSGSPAAVAGLELFTAQEIDAGIDAFNADAMARRDFARALAAAETWIATHCGAPIPDAADGGDPTSDFPLPTSLCEAAS
jgi:hypothetical protein